MVVIRELGKGFFLALYNGKLMSLVVSLERVHCTHVVQWVVNRKRNKFRVASNKFIIETLICPLESKSAWTATFVACI